MTMKPALIFALFLASTATLGSAHAQIYQWKDSSGRTVISDSPPPGKARSSREIAPADAPGSAPVASPASSAPKSLSEQNVEFKKRQQEARERSEKDAKASDNAARKRENCESAKSTVTALESERRFVVAGENGEDKLMDDGQRQAELNRARQAVSESCN